MTAHITVSEARAMGLDTPRNASQRPRKTAYATQCVKCGEVFRTMAGETRHVEGTDHRRFVLLFEGTT